MFGKEPDITESPDIAQRTGIAVKTYANTFLSDILPDTDALHKEQKVSEEEKQAAKDIEKLKKKQRYKETVYALGVLAVCTVIPVAGLIAGLKSKRPKISLAGYLGCMLNAYLITMLGMIAKRAGI